MHITMRTCRKIRWFSKIQRGTSSVAADSWQWLVVRRTRANHEHIRALRVRVKDVLVNLRLCMKVTSRRNPVRAKRTRQNCASCVQNKHASRSKHQCEINYTLCKDFSDVSGKFLLFARTSFALLVERNDRRSARRRKQNRRRIT